MPEKFPAKIESTTQVNFTINQFGLYALSATVRCEKKRGVRVEIDDMQFGKIPSQSNPQVYNVPPAWNGTELKGLSKTVTFILTLNTGIHTLKLIPNGDVFIDGWDYRPVQNPQNIVLDVEQQAEDGDKRPWLALALINLPLKSITAAVSVSWHLFDGDDVKLIVNNSVEQNTKSKLWRYWVWHATPQQILTGSRKERKVFTKNLPQGNHYIEFWADRTPILHQALLDLGDFQPERVPTVNAPNWTGFFRDDADQIILARAIFGEARNELVPDAARIAVGWVIRNRVESTRWPNTYWEVITEPWQYSSFNENDPNRPFVENPLSTDEEVNQKAWAHAYEIAGKIINNESQDPTQGANHYYDDSGDIPDWAQSRTPIFTVVYQNQTGSTSSILFYKL